MCNVGFLRPKWRIMYTTKNELLIKFGETVRQERLKRGISQDTFADIVGVHRTYIGMIERAEKNLTLLNIQKIAKALNLSISELLKDLWKNHLTPTSPQARGST